MVTGWAAERASRAEVGDRDDDGIAGAEGAVDAFQSAKKRQKRNRWVLRSCFRSEVPSSKAWLPLYASMVTMDHERTKGCEERYRSTRARFMVQCSCVKNMVMMIVYNECRAQYENGPPVGPTTHW